MLSYEKSRKLCSFGFAGLLAIKAFYAFIYIFSILIRDSFFINNNIFSLYQIIQYAEVIFLLLASTGYGIVFIDTRDIKDLITAVVILISPAFILLNQFYIFSLWIYHILVNAYLIVFAVRSISVNRILSVLLIVIFVFIAFLFWVLYISLHISPAFEFIYFLSLAVGDGICFIESREEL